MYKHIISKSPFRIFIRNGGSIVNQDLLTELGLLSYSPIEDFSGIKWGDLLKRYVYILETGEWKHVIDDYTYSVWHHPEVRPGIARLGMKYDILYCSLGDCDESFDFVYYENGKVRRKLVVESPNYGDRVITENIGIPFSFEDTVFNQRSDPKLIHDLAKNFGIRFENERDKIECFMKKYSEQEIGNLY